MFSSIASALSGLLGFSKGLNVLSNNIANMNTPGFKSSELEFRDLFYRYGLANGSGQEQLGDGVSTGPTRTVFRQGDLRETGNALDLAIDGNGFFVLRKDGDTFYTRAGQFAFNDDGVLVDNASGAHVAALQGGHLVDIDITGLRTNPARATSLVKFTGQLDTTTAAGSPYSTTATVFDASGVSHTLTVKFTNNGSNNWGVELLDGSTSIGTGSINYDGTGDPTAGQDSVTFSYDPPGVVGATAVTLNFEGTLSLSGGTNTLKMDTQNGFTVGSLVEPSFGEDGVLTLKYSNGQSVTRERLAFAWFEDLQALTLSGNNLFKSAPDQKVILDGPSQGGMGKLSAKHIELSNVQLTEQFTDMVVIQRGYQASSQVLSVTNEMIQQLMDIRSRR